MGQGCTPPPGTRKPVKMVGASETTGYGGLPGPRNWWQIVTMLQGCNIVRDGSISSQTLHSFLERLFGNDR